ncbi:hypothetical protein YC2023_043495 [Brassica napus]
MLSRSALYPQRSRTAYFVVTNSHLLSLPQVSLPANVQTEIEQIGEILNSSIAAITNSSNDIRDVLNSVRVALITVSILMLTSLQFLVSPYDSWMVFGD